MANFIDEILDDIDWRVAEMATLKVIPIRYRFTATHEILHIKYSIPAIYAVWEGFVKTAFTIYTNHLSSLNLRRSEISLNLLTHHIDTFCQLQNPRTNFETKKRIVSDLDVLFMETINLVPEIPTESNVNYKALCSIHDRFCVDKIDEKYKKGLDRLLFFRNKIAHGENALRVEMKDVSGFIKLVEDLMIEVVINIQDCEQRATFKKSPTGGSL